MNKPENDYKVSGKETNPYFPGIKDVVRDLTSKYFFKTLKEYDTSSESMYFYIPPDLKLPDSGTYKRGEPETKILIDRTYNDLLKRMISLTEQILLTTKNVDLETLLGKLNRKLHHDGTKNSEINEAMNMIRRHSFVSREKMNPDSHIPLMTGLLNLKSMEFEEFSPDKFYTWKVQGDFDPEIRSLSQLPMFKKFLLDVFHPWDVPTILDYLAYCLHPNFPRQKILLIVGQERRGKGTLIRILEKAIPRAHGRISLMKLLIPDNKFSFQDIEGKNVLIDPEIKRNFRYKADFGLFNTLFGGDTISIERKFKAPFDYGPKSKGILLSNIPLFSVDNTAFLARLLIVVAKMKPEEWTEIPHLDQKIWDAEGSKVVAYLLNRLKLLIKRDFRFTNEHTNQEYAELWNSLCKSAEMFMDENLIESKNYITIDDAFELYVDWCEMRSIPPESRHEFVRHVGKTYKKFRMREGRGFKWIFQNCSMELEVETPETIELDTDNKFGI